MSKNKYRLLMLLPIKILSVATLFAQHTPDTIYVQFLNTVDIEGEFERPLYKSDAVIKNVDEIMTELNGVNLIRRGNYASEVYYRGTDDSRVKSSIDGMRIFSACTDKMDPVTSYVESVNLESGTVNGNSQENHNACGTGGSLNLETRKARLSDSTEIHGSIISNYKSVSNGKEILFSTSFDSHDVGLRLSGSMRNHGNYTAGGGKEILYSGYNKENIAAAAVFRISEKTEIHGSMILDHAYDIGYPGLPMDVAFANGNIFSTSVNHKLNGRFFTELEGKIYTNSIRHLMDDTEREDIAMHMDMPGFSNTNGGYMDFKGSEGKHYYSGRLEYFMNNQFAEMTMFPENESEMYMVTWPDVYTRDAGISLNDQWNLSRNWSINLSSRYDFVSKHATDETGIAQFSIFGFDVSDKRTFQLMNHAVEFTNIYDKWQWGMEIAYAEREPTTSELFGYFLFNSQDGFDYMGTPDLNKELAYKIEAKGAVSLGSVDLGTSVFHHMYSDFIIGTIRDDIPPMTIGSNGLKQYVSLDGAVIYGFECNGKQRLWKGVTITESMAYLRGKDNNDGNLPKIAPFQVFISLEKSFERWFLKVESNIYAKQNQFNADYGEFATKGYELFHFRSGYSGKIRKVGYTLQAGIENIFDRVFVNHLDWNRIPGLGRNVFASLQVNM